MHVSALYDMNPVIGNLVEVSPYEKEVDYSKQIKETFARFSQGQVKNYLYQRFTDGPYMNQLEERILDCVAKINPELSKDNKETEVHNSFDIGLAKKLIETGDKMVCNDFAYLEEERVLIVLGPNQGGKTTFARMIGQIFYLSSLGVPIPGTYARLFLCDAVYTYFEREEDVNTLNGKLKDDLCRIHQIIEEATADSIIIMNEIFSSTTLYDAVFLGNRIVENIIKKGSLCVYVTFLEELSKLGGQTVSMVSMVDRDNNNERTYKVIRQMADGCAYALSIAEKYHLTYEMIKESRSFNLFSDYPAAIISQAIDRMVIYVEELKKLKVIASDKSDLFESDGFCSFFLRICEELPDSYFNEIESHLKKCRFQKGMLIGARLGDGNKSTGYIMREPNHPEGKWYQKIFHKTEKVYSFRLAPSDENGARALSELKMKRLNPIANALAQSADHTLNFFIILQKELSFYFGCMNLKSNLEKQGEFISYPVAFGKEERKLAYKDLYDIALSLNKKEKVIGNECDLNNKNLLIITGANQGGKNTFLRSLGQAQVMMQAGIFVGAKEYEGSICNGIYTHFKKEEDSEMKSGKLDEELNRMSLIITKKYYSIL